MKINFNSGGFGGFGNEGTPFGAGNFGAGNPFGFGFGAAPQKEEYQAQPKTAKKPRKGIKSPVKRTLINLLVTAIFGLIYFYVVLPPINLKAPEFYSFVFLLCVVYCVMVLLTTGFQSDSVKSYAQFVRKQCRIPFYIVIALIVVAIVGAIASSVILRAGAYQKLLPVETGNFEEEVDQLSFDEIPILDRDSATRLGNRKLGELSDMVSQFEVEDDYTQINYQGKPVRVTGLMYGDLIKWFNNRADGLPAYLIIDMTTQEVTVQRLDEGIKYTTAEHFNRNLIRYLRFNYPTYMFGEPYFEINEEGEPYWVCARMDKTIGLFGGVDVKGAVLVNAVSGECTYYDVADIPTWVDHVYNADLIMQQYNYYGRYINGFLNSILGQRDVTVTTQGYNYIAQDGDVYMYSGVTSAGTDASNVGFILSNQRTKETRYYPCAGADEYSAMSSAEGILQQMRYTATFPLLLNVSGEPTYFMAMKDNAGLVKQYAMVNVQEYQIVATGATPEACEAAYIQLLMESDMISSDSGEELLTRNQEEGTIAEIRTAVLEGNTYYFLRLESSDTFYSISAVECTDVVIMNVGDAVTISYAPTETGSILDAYSVSWTDRESNNTWTVPEDPSGEETTNDPAAGENNAAEE